MNTRGGATDGQRSISGRACLPILIVMIGLALLVAGGTVAAAVALVNAP